MIEIKPSNIKFDKTKFDEFQNKLDITMPYEYIGFLKKYNGGIPELNVVNLQDQEIKSFTVTDFFGINNEQINDLNSQYKVYKKRIPKGNIPICRTEGGNIVCLNINNGSVYLWDHDVELINNDVESLLYVAKNFEEFLKLMKPYEQEENLDDYKVEDVWIDPNFLNEVKNDID